MSDSVKFVMYFLIKKQTECQEESTSPARFKTPVTGNTFSQPDRFELTTLMFRYTMPRMVLKQESRLNGVKTNVTNLNDVAHALRVPAGAIIKYFCAEVGANQEQDTIVKGSHTAEDL